ncbi:MAG: NADH dehydrogenase, FAD-containing subunit [Candidatus Giovannonibacteria bacterium GW2011_GWA2_44_13b]|uniref:NADH dehydrogenase, FAD-containing subunit n=2 Tax=Candidatus Giovannoniibacteriota TaxID=1752738 RepID=A0A0G1H3C9_9BACT|nr:MAG: NADH dehydrogenase, FAD-containing subunit [Candidatus Giovannonibacteria bacterium GW2011_GWA2_44_13b]
MMKEVVIVGGGAAGANIAKKLAKWHKGAKMSVHITLIDKSRYHTFQPFLYEVATAHLPESYREGPNPLDFFDLKSSTIYPLEDMFLDDLNVSVVEDEVTGINFKAKTVGLKNTEKDRHYDILVLSAGSDTNYFGNAGLSEYALPLKNFFDALEVRNAIDEAFASAPKNQIVTIMIGGGGFSGCELAGELPGYFEKLAELHGRPKGSYECVIVEATDKVLGPASPWLQKKTFERLTKLGIKFKFQSPIKDVKDHEVVFGNGLPAQAGEKMHCDVLIWTAGVKANDIVHGLAGVVLQKASCMMVDKFLHILPYENVFAVGDLAFCVDENTGKSLPMTGSVAIREAAAVAENIKRIILKKKEIAYTPYHAGFIVPLGGKYALLEAYGMRISGYLAWLAKYAVAVKYWAPLVGAIKAFKIVSAGMKVYSAND